MRKFLLSLLILSSLYPITHAAEVVDIYSGKGSACLGNMTYTYDYNTLQYACIIEKPDGGSMLILNGKEDPLYAGAETVNFSSSGIINVSLRKGALHQIVIGNYRSPWYLMANATLDTQGNFIINFQDSDGYGWSYNGEVRQSKGSVQSYVSSFFYGESLGVFEQNSNNYGGWYDRIILGGKATFSGYSHIYYQGEYTRKNTSVLIFFAQKGEKVEVLAYKKDGTILRLQSVPGKLDTYQNFSMKSDSSQFAFTLSEGEKYRVVTEKGMLPEVYDAMPTLLYYDKLGLYKQVYRDGKVFFSLGKKTFGPYDFIGSLPSITTSGKSWFIMVTRGDKEYLIVNGKEILL